jgi:hypothetical protein
MPLRGSWILDPLTITAQAMRAVLFARESGDVEVATGQQPGDPRTRHHPMHSGTGAMDQ